jgi:Tol biopolymer transport system component
LEPFEAQGEIGKPVKAGLAVAEPMQWSLLVTGGGENMWFTNDAGHFVWARVSGDFQLKAAIAWVVAGGDPHRKACLMVRQSLDADSAYVDLAFHGNSLTSLQFRETRGGPTHEIQVEAPSAYSLQGSTNGLASETLGIERQGDTFFSLKAMEGSLVLSPSGAFMRVALTDPVYVGLAVCAHNDKALESARFTRLALTHLKPDSDRKPQLHCTLETVAIASRDRRAIYHTLDHIEAPNWSRDGSNFFFNAGGRIYRMPVSGTERPVAVDTGFAVRCNNDHGFSPDGKRLAISDQTRGGKSLIYTLSISGGEPVALTTRAPSYWHGWSPDGSTLAYCAEREGEFDIYTILAAGGEEKRLTTAKGLDDGPDYTADGRFIYFNSERSGSMQIWRMKPDGSDQEAVTSDDFNNWFPHPSPDDKWLIFLSYEKGVTGHPANQPVRLRLMPLGGGPIQELARLLGGQGTINVPSWSPDSKQVAFVSYELLR